MLLWFLSKPIRPFGTIQQGWSSILGRGEVPRTSCFTSSFQVEWNSFFFWKEKRKGERETLPFFPQCFCGFRVGHMLMNVIWHNCSISSLCKLATATLWGLFLFGHCCTLLWICREPLLLFHDSASSVVTFESSQRIFIVHLALLPSPSPLCAEELCGVHWDSWHCGWDLPPLRSDIQHTKAEVRATCPSARGTWSHCSYLFAVSTSGIHRGQQSSTLTQNISCLWSS